MADERTKRRLAAILALDVEGYTRLTEQDEEGTHRRLMALMREVVEPLIAECDGRVIKRTGDGALCEFASVVEATRCAAAIQRAIRARSVDEPLERLIAFRSGINLGDVLVEPDEIYGEGVNIAVRLQALAQPGGICVSEVVADQVGDKLDLVFVDIGEHRLRNISRPTRVFRVDLDAQPVAMNPAPARPGPVVPGFDGRPAIAVLPFSNLSGDPEQEYFADGITEDIITLLAAWRALPVIARNSVFTYKGRHVDVRTIGRELGVRYVLEGSVRRQNTRIRITAQLVDAETNQYCFADRYDREVTSLFAVQDEIVENIVGEVEPELLRLERERAVRLPPERLNAYDSLQRGLWHHYRYTEQDNVQAQALFRQAIALDPSWSEPLAALAVVLLHSFVHGWQTSEIERLLSEALDFAKQAVASDSRNPQAHYAIASSYFHTHRIGDATRGMETVIRLNPSHAAAHANLGNIYNYLNQPERGLISVQTALRLSPSDPRRFIWIPALAGSHYLTRSYEQAIEAGRSGLAIKSDYLAPMRYIVAGLGQLGRRAEAESMLPMLRKLDPTLAHAEAYLARYYVAREALDHILDGLRKAGLD